MNKQFHKKRDDVNGIEQKIKKLIEETDSHSVDQYYMLYLLKSHDYHKGIVQCCEKYPELRAELLTHYIKQNDSAKVVELCRGIKNLDTARELWFQALTYLRDQEDPERYIEQALETIRERNIL